MAYLKALIKKSVGISLAGQWLRLHIFSAGTQVRFLIMELRSQLLHWTANKKCSEGGV